MNAKILDMFTLRDGSVVSDECQLSNCAIVFMSCVSSAFCVSSHPCIISAVIEKNYEENNWP